MDISIGSRDLVTVPARQGLEAMDILLRGRRDAAQGGRGGLGPVLHDGRCDTLGFIVPPGTAEGWDLPGSNCIRTHGRGIRAADFAQAPPVTGTGWLVAPGEAEPVTDPTALRAALGEAARLIEAADRCR